MAELVERVEFNENRGCIEIMADSIGLTGETAFNENRGCIEIYKAEKARAFDESFNENRGCIEMHGINNKATAWNGLMKTEVVLKSIKQTQK